MVASKVWVVVPASKVRLLRIVEAGPDVVMMLVTVASRKLVDPVKG